MTVAVEGDSEVIKDLPDCQVNLINTSSSNTAPTGTCSETLDGVTHAGTTAIPTLTAGGGATLVACTLTAAAPGTVGAQVVGTILLNNDAQQMANSVRRGA